jgi:CheY-like chemotaxis protein
MQQILVIEDDGALQRVLKRLFETEDTLLSWQMTGLRVWNASAKQCLPRLFSIYVCRTSLGKKSASA